MSNDKVVWKEGMLLRPQHFQQQDRYLDQQKREGILQMNRYGWGFFSLAINATYLPLNKVVLSTAQGVLPDGSLFNLPEALKLEIPPGHTSTSVYLGLALATDNQKDTRAKGDKELARYVTCENKLTDTNVGAHSQCDMVCATHDLHLLLGNDANMSHLITLKVCEVRAADNGQGIVIVEEFTPTCLHASGDKGFAGYLEVVQGMLGARGAQLAQRVGSIGEVGGAEIGDFLMLQVVNRHESTLRHLQRAPRVHPEDIYLAMTALLSDLCVFDNSTKRTNPSLAYNHEDQRACLSEVVDAISALLAMVLEKHAVRLPITPAKFGVLVAKMTDHSLPDTSFFVLVASAGCGAEQLRSRLPAQLKVGTVETLRDMVNLHLPGIKIAPLAVAPRQLPFHAHKAYFRLELDAAQLAGLKATAGIAMHLSDELDGFEVELWAIRKSAS